MRLLHPGEYKAMTFDEVMKCQPGTSLDLLVTQACGLEWTPLLFCPSTDWNDAMRAAVKSGLFATGPGDLDSFGFIDRVTDGGPYKWRVCRHRYNVNNSLAITVIATAETGPLAICRAILLNSRTK